MTETGIYIRVGKDNVLLENLHEVERTLWLQSLSEEGLIRTVNRCCDVIEDFIVNYQHLQTNWKELNKWLEEEIKKRATQMVGYHPSTQSLIEQIIETEKMVLNKMQEIESGKNE